MGNLSGAAKVKYETRTKISKRLRKMTWKKLQYSTV